MIDIVLSFGLLLGAAPVSDSWLGFRGTGDGVATAQHLPLTWTENENVLWKIDLPGYGQSAPVVWKNQIFVTAVDGEQRDRGMILAYDRAKGVAAWKHTFEPTQKAKWSFSISRAAPTPCVDATALFAFFEGGDVIALTHEGKPLWSRSLVKDYGEFQNGHGLSSSLAQTESLLFVLIDHRGPSYLAALDKKSGMTIWKTERKSRGSWTSPIVSTRDGRSSVIVSSNGSVAGYDAEKGHLLWEHEGLNGNTIPSAAPLADGRFLIGAGLGRMGGDAKDAARSNCCIQLQEVNGKLVPKVAWSASKALANYATPLAYRGHAYFVNSVGVVYCHDLKTGEECYAERIDGSCWASPIGAGDHVYFFGKDGTTTVLKAGNQFEVVARNRLWKAAKKETPANEEPKTQPERKEIAREPSAEYLDPIVYGVAAVDGAFLIRTGKVLYSIGTK